MRRRDFIVGLGGAAAWPVVARAQQPAMPVIGFLHSGFVAANRETISAFHQGLAVTGFVEGRNVTITYRWAEGRNDRLPGLAFDLVHYPVNVVATFGTPAALAAKAATANIPIVFSVGNDPVEMGLVASFNRPGGNLTGAAELYTKTITKCLEAMHELVPETRLIGLIVNPTNPTNSAITQEADTAARALGAKLVTLSAASPSEIDAAFVSLVAQHSGALLVSADPFFSGERERFAALASQHRIPAIYFDRVFVEAGGLMSYGTNLRDSYRQVGIYAGRILAGDRPASLPVQQVTKIELVLNVKTAKALGLTIPETLLATADEVIQ
jgi:putative tryptophan/tyrosine transport system substrate-binding protein